MPITIVLLFALALVVLAIVSLRSFKVKPQLPMAKPHVPDYLDREIETVLTAEAGRGVWLTATKVMRKLRSRGHDVISPLAIRRRLEVLARSGNPVKRLLRSRRSRTLFAAARSA